ncbi:MAG: hypothetical protein R3B89_10370 [Polyangiaceae bacterium]
MSARLDAGMPRDAVLKDAGLSQQQWEEELVTWLSHLSEQIQRQNYELYQRYTQWFLQNRLEAERQLGLQSAPQVAAPREARRNEAGDWEYLRWQQQQSPAQVQPSAPAPPALVQPPPVVSSSGEVPPLPAVASGIPPMPSYAPAVPPMPTISGVPPMPNAAAPASAPAPAPAPSVESVPPLPSGVAPPPLISPVPASGPAVEPPMIGGVSAPGIAAPPAVPSSGGFFVSQPPSVSPAAPPSTAPAPSSVPQLSLGDYAMLAAEIVVMPEQVERALAKYGIGDLQVWQAIQQSWEQRLRSDGYEMENYQERFESAKRHWRSVYKR